jgi:glycosyltransferase involved in cell wall biosynthesis
VGSGERAARRREILFYSDFPLGYHNREPEEKMARFARRGYRVKYVEQLGISDPRPHHVARLARLVLRRQADGREEPFEVVSPKLLPPRRAPLVRSLNRRWLTRQLLSRLEDPSEAIFWVRYPTPELLDVIEAATPRLVVYDAADEHVRSPGLPARLRRLVELSELRLLARAGVVFASSEAIHERLSVHHGNVVLAPAAAVDLELFAQAAGKPARDRTAVYAGSIDFRFDADLVAAAAERLREWSFVLAGPVLGTRPQSLAGLPNVRLLGSLPAGEIPGVLAGGSVCIMPYRQAAFSHTLFPVKLVEYLAAGRPVVSTPLRALREFSDVVTLASGAQAFADGIEAAAGEDSPEARERRIARARPFAWETRIDELEGAIQAALGNG